MIKAGSVHGLSLQCACVAALNYNVVVIMLDKIWSVNTTILKLGMWVGVGVRGGCEGWGWGVGRGWGSWLLFHSMSSLTRGNKCENTFVQNGVWVMTERNFCCMKQSSRLNILYDDNTNNTIRQESKYEISLHMLRKVQKEVTLL